ncbi:MAG: hypothetical protein IJH83_00235 [Coriobacteriales bacterium]|nr:hypothetical protein [Coriobacteriales bacterium]
MTKKNLSKRFTALLAATTLAATMGLGLVGCGAGTEGGDAAQANNTEIVATVSDDANATQGATDQQAGQPPAMPGGQQPGEPPNGSGGPGGPGGGSSTVEQGSAATEITTDGTYSKTTYSSNDSDENALRVTGATVTLDGITVNKTGGAVSNTETGDFYGMNAGLLATDGAQVTITGATVNTSAQGGNGVFSYGSGTVVNISDSTITTTANNSGGIQTTGGATTNATNLTVNTSGNSSAAIRSDRGGGTVNVTDGSYSSAGTGSPAIYCTADITVTGAVLKASNSESVVIEGGNNVTLNDCTVTGNDATLNGQATYKTNVLIYQSMSGDAAEGNSTFTMNGGSMTALTGAMFHVTNVTTTITLSDVDFTYASDSKVFLDASSDSWGTSGGNGGHVTLILDNQDITGAISMDANSSVDLTMKNGSTWKLTADSYVTSLSGDTSGIDLNGHTLYVNGVAWSK